MAYADRSLRGIGGWLAFFLITLILNMLAALVLTVVTLLHLGGMSAAPGQQWGAYMAVVAMLGLVKVGGFGYMIWRLNSAHVASTPPLVIKLLWAYALAPAVIDIVAGMALLGIDARQAGVLLAGELIRPLFYAAIWTAYLLRSERVANTYTGAADTDHLAAVFD